ncbi:YjbF family lipoprotein [Roseomonas sp. NAR14]|uniref:YjbF family lipoprotein n=1 Tax=Roseomonas acroporae TaxID=2937791 RepID=A0A9X1Y6X3_9PROT|nr:YjbF family lipoprotein [Roseomonas acroporae]MCK8785299.1 YjbF family lipoprotein [Roseomonas acroporae]
MLARVTILVLAFPWVLLVAACGETPAGDLLREAFALPSFGGADRTTIRADDAAAAAEGPALRLGYGSRDAVATLLEQNGEQRLWRTLDGVVVATAGPRVVATAGLSDILAGTRLDGPDPLEAPLELVGRETALRRQVDLMGADREPSSMRFGLTVECRLAAARVEEDGERAVLVEERCRSASLGRFTNRYWADPVTGAVFRSEQWVGARAGPLRIDVLNAPAS